MTVYKAPMEFYQTVCVDCPFYLQIIGLEERQEGNLEMRLTCDRENCDYLSTFLEERMPSSAPENVAR